MVERFDQQKKAEPEPEPEAEPEAKAVSNGANGAGLS
jgi:hypothetical protein